MRLLEGKKSRFFLVWSGSGYLLYMFSNDLLVEVQEAGLGVQLSSGKIIGELFFQMTLWALVTKTQAKLTIIKAESIFVYFIAPSVLSLVNFLVSNGGFKENGD